jgi:hypothetical protein
MRTGLLFIAAVAAVCFIALSCGSAWACDCAWGGPFFKVAHNAVAVVRAVVSVYHGESPVGPTDMDVQIIEVLSGEAAPSPMRVWGSNGAMCRPYTKQFPLGTEWILAFNGPGSKPGMTPGYGLSNCGTYWLKVENGEGVGNLDDETKMDAVQRMPLAAFKKRFAAERLGPGEKRDYFTGRVKAGDRFEKKFGDSFIFALEPDPEGWTIVIKDSGGKEDISRLTPPYHFAPNPREIKTRYLGDPEKARRENAPGNLREFIFSPAVGKTIDGPDAGRPPTREEIKAVADAGSGKLKILEFKLSEESSGSEPRLEWLRFSADLRWKTPQSGGAVSK